MTNNVLIILGMHRSGTSLTASWLHRCGLNIGENLAGNAIGNTKGQFEDIDFMKLHIKVLKANRLTYKINDQSINTSNSFLDFKELINSKNKSEQWGWKEPRTCLFLKEYNELIPNAKSLVVYRRYDEVVDSLVRRFIKTETKSTRRNKFAKYYNLKIKYKYLKSTVGNEWLRVWIRYNQEILNYLKKKNKDDYIVIDIDCLLNNDKEVFNVVSLDFKFNLEKVSFKEIYERNLITTDGFPYKFSKKLLGQANQIHNEFIKLKFK